MTILSQICPECGAQTPPDLSCRDMLAAILGWEGADPELFILHFFTVACFNLQHPAQFTDEALAGLITGFRKVMDGIAPVSSVRRQAARAFEGKRRVLKPEADRDPVRAEWEFTIKDVYAGGRSTGAAPRVRHWAEVIRSRLPLKK